MPPYIPPGYTGVKVFKDPKSKIYAFGFDKKGRKQIIYNKWFVERQRQKRFRQIMGLREAIKTLTARIEQVLGAARPDIADKEVHIALILKLMMQCNFRIGNAKYLKDNGSYGLTTLEWKHITLHKSQVNIEFIGKKGVLNKSVCGDRMVVNVMQRMYKKSNEGLGAKIWPAVFAASSKEVNSYIGKFGDMTAKDIRTWHANYLFVKYFKAAEKEGLSPERSRSAAIKRVAEALHNTPAVCKKNYLLPDLVGE